MTVLVITEKHDGKVVGIYGPFSTLGEGDDFLADIFRTVGRELGLQYTVTNVTQPITQRF